MKIALLSAATLAFVIGGVLFAASATTSTASPAPENSLEILRLTSCVLGPQQSQAKVLRSAEDLKKLRLNRRPTVDFETESAVLVAIGWQSTTGHSVVIERLELRENVLHIYAKQSGPKRIAGMFPTSPFSIAVVKKLPADLKIQMHGATLRDFPSQMPLKPINFKFPRTTTNS